jgi:hypothetical protein
LVCCGALGAEVESLRRKHWPLLPMRLLQSMLHMEPACLGAKLETLVNRQLEGGTKVGLIYGDCCERVSALECREGVARTRCLNCAELLLGRDEYRRLSRAGAFFMLPEWTRRWREVFAVRLGLSEENAAGLMGDLHTRMLYLDTGVTPVPVEAITACARYCGLPWEVLPVSLDCLRAAVGDAMARLGLAGTAT